MDILSRFLQGGEEGILRECSKMIYTALDANKELSLVIKNRQGIGKLRELEKRGDKERFRISNIVTSGAVAPNLIDNVLVLVSEQDKIINATYNLARELRRYQLPDKKLENFMKTKLLDMNSLNETALNTIMDMYKQDDLEKIHGLREDVEDLEEAGDEIKEALLDIAYSSSGKIDFRGFYHIIQTAHRADDILDGCEDTSDTFMTIVSSIVT